MVSPRYQVERGTCLSQLKKQVKGLPLGWAAYIEEEEEEEEEEGEEVLELLMSSVKSESVYVW